MALLAEEHAESKTQWRRIIQNVSNCLDLIRKGNSRLAYKIECFVTSSQDPQIITGNNYRHDWKICAAVMSGMRERDFINSTNNRIPHCFLYEGRELVARGL